MKNNNVEELAHVWGPDLPRSSIGLQPLEPTLERENPSGYCVAKQMREEREQAHDEDQERVVVLLISCPLARRNGSLWM